MKWNERKDMVKCESKRSWQYAFHYCCCLVYNILNILLVVVFINCICIACIVCSAFFIVSEAIQSGVLFHVL
jgi:hypothetical protein